MTTLQDALEHFRSNAKDIGYSYPVVSNDSQPHTMIVGDDNEGLRLTWDIENSRLVVTVTHGPDPSCFRIG